MEIFVKITKIVSIILFIIGLVFVIGTITRSDTDAEIQKYDSDAQIMTDEEFYDQLKSDIRIMIISVVTFGIALTADLISERVYFLRNKWNENDPDKIISREGSGSPEAEQASRKL